MSVHSHSHAALPAGTKAVADCIGGWVGPRASRKIWRREEKKLTAPAFRTPDRPACSLVEIPTTLSHLNNGIKITHILLGFKDLIYVQSAIQLHRTELSREIPDLLEQKINHHGH